MQETFEKILDFFSHLLIRGIFISVLVMLILRALSKNRIETDISFQIIRWIILVYAFGFIVNFILLIIFDGQPDYMSYFTNVYSCSHFITSSIIPLTLLNKKLSNKAFYILFVSLLTNNAWLMESFIIHVPVMFRDGQDYSAFLPDRSEVRAITNGFILGLVSLLIGYGITKLKPAKTNKT